jgi:hypothetical protein
MTVQKSDLLSYVRGLDLRLESKTDSEILSIIQYGINNLSDAMLCFFTQETITLNDYQALGLDNFMYTLSKYSIGELHIKLYADGEEVVNTNVDIEQIDNNNYNIKILTTITVQTDIVFSYFYTPDITNITTLVVEPEVFHFLKHSIQVVAWGGLKDYEKEQYHQKVWDEHIKTRRLTFPVHLERGSLKGGFV